MSKLTAQTEAQILEIGNGVDGNFYKAIRELRNGGEAHGFVSMVVAGSGIHEDTVWDAILELA